MEKVHCLVNYLAELLGVGNLASPYIIQQQNVVSTSRYCSFWPHATYMCFLPAAQLFAASQL